MCNIIQDTDQYFRSLSLGQTHKLHKHEKAQTNICTLMVFAQRGIESTMVDSKPELFCEVICSEHAARVLERDLPKFFTGIEQSLSRQTLLAMLGVVVGNITKTATILFP